MPNVPRPDAPDVNVSKQTGIENREIAERLNGNLSLGTGVHTQRTGNVNGQWLRHTFTVPANQAVKVWHGLGRVPIGYQVWEADRACSVYSVERGSWTDTHLYLACDAKGAEVLLMVI